MVTDARHHNHQHMTDAQEKERERSEFATFLAVLEIQPVTDQRHHCHPHHCHRHQHRHHCHQNHNIKMTII